MKQGWKVEKLGDICKNLDSQRIPVTQRDRKSGEYPYYGASGIVDYVDKYIFDEDLLLVSEDGANLLARTYPIAYSVSGKIWVNNHAHVLRFENIISQRFVEYYLNSISLEKYVNGMAQPKLNQAMLNSIAVPYPPLPEQQRIVALLDEAFVALDTVHANAERNLHNSNEIFDLYLETVLNDVTYKWVTKELGDLCTGVEYGSSAKSQKAGKIPVLRMGNIQNGRFDWSYLVYTSDKDEIEKYSLKHNDVLFNRTNSLELVGKTAIYKSEMPAIFAGYLIRIHRKEDLIDADYLNYFLNSDMAKKYGRTVVISSVNQANINGQKLKTYPVPLLPLEEQRAIVARLNELAIETKRLEAIYQCKLEQAEELRKSISGRAFEGLL